MASSAPIGIFDSGLGGLTGYRALRSLNPSQPLIYFGDTARVPYGTKSKECIRGFALQDARFLLSKGVQAILVACGTVSSNALDLLQNTFSLPIIGVVSPAAEKAVQISRARTKKVLVLGTPATVKSNSYKEAICKMDDSIQVLQQACPLFVPLVENLHTRKGDIAATAIAHEYLDPYLEFHPDAIILGCTHFPLLSEIISEIVPDAELISSAGEAAITMTNIIQALPQDPHISAPLDSFYTSDDAASFAEDAAHFLGSTIVSASHIDIETY